MHPAPSYPATNPAHSGCDSIETPGNPGPLTDPIVSMHHSVGALSLPPGVIARCTVGGTFYTGACYPKIYQGALFTTEWGLGWLRAAVVDESNALVELIDFAQNLSNPVDIEAHPITGDLYVLTVSEGRIQRISYRGCGACPPADIDDDGVIGFADLLLVLSLWGEVGVPADVDESGVVDFGDILAVLASWGPCA